MVVKPTYLLLSLLLIGITALNASFNVTYLNTTVIINQNASAHVVESYLITANGTTSVILFDKDTQAINLSLSQWQQVLGTTLLAIHISSFSTPIYHFTFLPSSMQVIGNNGQAHITLTYDVNNITTVKLIAPRKYEYIFDSSYLDFPHSASGESLPTVARLNLIIPNGSSIVSIYPLPDSPHVNFFANYTGTTEFSWYGGEPLSDFSFSYIATQSLGQEVLTFFNMVEARYGGLILPTIVVLIIIIILYLYYRASESKG